MTSPLLITGASGTIGKELVKQLQVRGAGFAVMSSKPATVVGGIPAVLGDFADGASLRQAFAGVQTLFLLFPFTPESVDLARNAVEAARASGVKHIVRSSGAGAQAGSPVAIADLQGRIDAMIERSGIAYTLLRPAGFMQNWVNFYAGQIKAGSYAAAHGDAAITMVDVRDIAEVAAVILSNPAAHAGRTYTLTGGEALSTGEQVAMISRAIGRPVRYEAISPEQAEAALRGWGLPPAQIALYSSLAHVYRQGWAAGLSADVQTLTGHAPRSFADFVREHATAWQ
ncbi:MAG TPA: SDR family oxidoreductase [Burkholderiaceae bacterium]|nr:SDR family oxidoreductase [Burkholderiaceae bacterium]